MFEVCIIESIIGWKYKKSMFDESLKYIANLKPKKSKMVLLRKIINSQNYKEYKKLS